MALDLETLLAPTTKDPPCGPDLAYDPKRLAIETAFDQPFSIDPSGQTAAADETDWNVIIQQIVDQLTLTKDLCLPVYLCRAGARGGQLDVVEEGTELLAQLLTRYWDPLHPILENGDPVPRKLLCDSLGAQAAFLAPLQRISLLVHPRLGAFTAGDIERFARGEGDADYATFQGVLSEIGPAPLEEALGRIQRVLAHLRTAEGVFAEKTGNAAVPDFMPAYEALGRMAQSVQKFVPQSASDDDVNKAGAGTVVTSAGSASTSGSVQSREDVLRGLERICEYYRIREPSSPVPLLLERAKSWVTLSFLDVLSDIAPESLPEVRRVVTKREGS